MLTQFLCCCCDVLEEEKRPWSDWSDYEPALTDATGLSREMFNYVYDKCSTPLIDERLHMHSGRGKTYSMSTHNMLAITLHWIRNAPSFHSLPVHFHDFAQTTLHRVVHQVIEILDIHLVPLLILPIDASAPSSRRASVQNETNAYSYMTKQSI